MIRTLEMRRCFFRATIWTLLVGVHSPSQAQSCFIGECAGMGKRALHQAFRIDAADLSIVPSGIPSGCK
jgi:hypothetical protein